MFWQEDIFFCLIIDFNLEDIEIGGKDLDVMFIFCDVLICCYVIGVFFERVVLFLVGGGLCFLGGDVCYWMCVLVVFFFYMLEMVLFFICVLFWLFLVCFCCFWFLYGGGCRRGLCLYFIDVCFSFLYFVQRWGWFDVSILCKSGVFRVGLGVLLMLCNSILICGFMVLCEQEDDFFIKRICFSLEVMIFR